VVVDSLESAVQQVEEAFADSAARTVVLAGGYAAAHGGAASSAAGRRRIDGVPPEWPHQLIAANACDVVIVEADGARKLPFKAPADNEPVLPLGATTVIAVGGVDALGTPIAEDFVCRAHIVAEVAELPLGVELTATAMGSVLGSRMVWRVPESVEKFVACVNKADTAPLQEAAASIAREAVGLSAGCDFALITGERQTPSERRRGTIFAKILPHDDCESDVSPE
jgi:probable selenium-dependent hydroxylase accessory protein YqeC